MIVDSSALPEQVTRDVVASAFQSAGQRCSALRVLFVQEDVADTMLAMIARRHGGAQASATRATSTTDVGPVIDEDAKAALDEHLAGSRRRRICRAAAAQPAAHGSFVAPVMPRSARLAS
jgi:RHH-type proline utilization regulon transcriptional repressor/proline dehydrogenase/delta 1-pyrroline-5-carboxylate dehydrogenase